ncbi:hypothetical protein [Asticcacaulis excentricus]|uniref:PE-PGRS family protein n=1 Tax=Asticcacaulis excentricus (strain ATCC 15261 / DSM 4724 / KCTC 12464 / NCIMB 9791 / VKM B-1370 / CB 48) TaxID=573065 RepID=E8RV38_ASTEC|nr:hypothetical protein [Asticcacaulis excentricus]ADU14238.1 hypothetical protein Astex_2593 [Asticcacaulis excentricus CB 48]
MKSRVLKFALMALLLALGVPGGPTLAQVKSQDEVPDTKADFNPKVITVTTTGSLREMANKAGYDGGSRADFIFEVPAGTVIMGAAGGNKGRRDGGPALVSGLWPETAEIWLLVRGHVYGGGGRGGDGGDPVPTDGGRGGDAVVADSPMTVVVLKGGAIKGGGGGGAGAEAAAGLGGSGGGGGFPNGDPGLGGSARASDTGYFEAGALGRAGSPGGGGGGGNRGIAGGTGGNAAMPGQSQARVGGAPGNAIRKSGHEVVILSGGQVYGEIF